jgi:hypothetical protein
LPVDFFHSVEIVATCLGVNTLDRPNRVQKPSFVAQRETVASEHPIFFAACVAVTMFSILDPCNVSCN